VRAKHPGVASNDTYLFRMDFRKLLSQDRTDSYIAGSHETHMESLQITIGEQGDASLLATLCAASNSAIGSG